MPLLQDEKPPLAEFVKPDPPRRDFPILPNVAKLTITKPSSISLKEFQNKVMELQRFLLDSSINFFQAEESKTMVSWTSVFAIDCTAGVMGQIGLKMPSTNQPGPLLTPESEIPHISPLLAKL